MNCQWWYEWFYAVLFVVSILCFSFVRFERKCGFLFYVVTELCIKYMHIFVCSLFNLDPLNHFIDYFSVYALNISIEWYCCVDIEKFNSFWCLRNGNEPDFRHFCQKKNEWFDHLLLKMAFHLKKKSIQNGHILLVFEKCALELNNFCCKISWKIWRFLSHILHLIQTKYYKHIFKSWRIPCSENKFVMSFGHLMHFNIFNNIVC